MKISIKRVITKHVAKSTMVKCVCSIRKRKMRNVSKFEYLEGSMEENEEILDTDELMHEYQEWEEDYAEKQTEMYLDNI